MRRFLFAILSLLCVSVADAQAQYDKHYFVWLGRDMVMQNRYRDAIETLNMLLRVDADSYEGYFWRGVAKYNLDDLIGAERDLSMAIEKNPVYTNAYQFRALTRSRLGNYGDAMRDYQEAIELRPDYLAPYFSRGVTRILTGDYDGAVEDFNMYLRYNQRDADAFANRGVAYLNLCDTVAACADFERAIRTNREHPRGYMERGSVYMAQGRYTEAEEDFNRAVECDTTYVPAYFSRAMANYEQHRLMEAMADFDKVLELDPASSVTYFNRALLRTEVGDYNRALEDYNAVAEYSPDNVIVYYNRAGLNLRLGDLDAALADYDRAIELYPDFANAYLGRADVKYLLRDTRGAERDRKTAESKIAAYRARLERDGEVSFADTARQFDRLLSFDTRMSDAPIRSAIAGKRESVTLRPLYRFTLGEGEDRFAPMRPGRKEAADFISLLGTEGVVFTCAADDADTRTVIALDRSMVGAASGDSWQYHFMRGITQALLRQYTNAVKELTAAVLLEPGNPFLYMERSAVQAEMTDFISSINGSYSRISLESDRSSGMGDIVRYYSYDEAIADLNKAAKLAPELPQIYYNRGNLYALSGDFPAAFADYSRAVELDPYFAEAYFNRGLVQIYMKDTRTGLLDIGKAGELGIGDAYEVLDLYSGGAGAEDRNR